MALPARLAARRIGAAVPRLAAAAPAQRGLSAKAGAAPPPQPQSSVFAALDTFAPRHIGPRDGDIAKMLAVLGYDSLDAFVRDAVPAEIRLAADGQKETAGAQDGRQGDRMASKRIAALSESELARRGRAIADMNRPVKSLIGLGYHNTNVPPVILRNVSATCGDPAWPPACGCHLQALPGCLRTSCCLVCRVLCLTRCTVDPREPGMVHVLHALPARDLAG
jgi:glycine dehydrogenase